MDADGLGDFLTITDALYASASGDTVSVAAGTYGPSTGEFLPWYIPDHVTLAGAGPDLTVVDCEGEGTAAWLPATSEGVAIDGMAVTGCTDTAWYHGSSFSDCLFVGNSGDTAGALSATNATIVDCEFRDNEASDPNGVTSIRASGSALIGVTVSDSPTTCQYSVSAQSVYPAGYSSVEASTFVGGSIVVQGEVSNSLFSGLAGCDSATSEFSDVCLSVTSDWIESSTIVGCSGAIALVGSYARNNIVAFNAGHGVYSSYAAYNLVYENGAGDWFRNDWSGMLGNTTGDPLFRDFSDDGDWTDDDLRLSTGSPAIDAASGDYPSADLDGVHRPQDGDGDGTARADIGAYEWGLADHDGDGWAAEAGDCDDLDAETSPDTPEIPYDGIDQDCDGEDLVDVDGDGHDADHQGGDDCDDTDASIHPGTWDIPDDGIDQDCDGVDAHDEDGDGWSEEAGDCAPDDDAIHPGADELCDGVDNDCNGLDDDDCDTGVAADDTGTPDDTGADDGGDGGDDTAGGGTDTGVGGQPGGRGGLCGCRGCDDGGSGGAAWVLLPLLAVRRRRG